MGERMKKKYLVIEGEVCSQYDYQFHFINAETLIKLYGVNRKECVIVRAGQPVRGVDVSRLTVLRPRYDGNYDILNKER